MKSEEKEKSKIQFRRPILHKIVNVFVGFTAFLFFLLIIFFGFSQTKTFRNILKNEIIKNVNSSINGKIDIDEIEGSVLTSVLLHNTSLTAKTDTIFKAKELIVKISPVHIFLKRILVRDIIIKDGIVNLTEDESGIWSFSKLTKEEESEVKNVSENDSDSSSSKFPFAIQINNLQIENLDFTRQTFGNLNSVSYYKHLTYNDLQLKNINLNVKLFANFSTSTVRLFLNNFSLEPNFELFNLKKLSGEFEFTEQYAQVRNFRLVTDSTNLNFSAKVEELNLLGDVELRNFKEYPMSLQFDAYPFAFSDLYTFLPDVDFLNGAADLNLKANGQFGNFTIEELNMGLPSSILNVKGNVQNLHTPENLFIDVEIYDSKIVHQEAHDVIKGLNIPLYKDLVVEKLNATFKGEPTKFNASLQGNVKDGNLEFDTYLNLQPEEMEYDIKFKTSNLNLFPILGFQSSLTSTGTIKGVGTDPNKMSANLNISAFNSVIDSISVDSLFCSTIIDSKLLDVDIKTIVNKAYLDIKGKLDLRDENEPFYDLFGEINNLSLDKFTGEKKDSSDLSIEFIANGKSFNIDDMVGFYELKLRPSYLRNLNLEETSIQMNLLKSEDFREIQLVSDFVDFTIEGQFSLEKAISILSYESITIFDVVSKKIDELNPIASSSESIDEINNIIGIPDIAKENLEFSYKFIFKDFELIALILDSEALDITGYGEGTVSNDSLNFNISTDLSIENLLNKTDNNILYLSNVNAYLNFNRDNREVSFNKMFGSISVEGEKAYTGLELNDIEADFIFNQSKLFFNTSINIENKINTQIEGIATTILGEERLDISNINFSYKNVPWQNFDTCVVHFTDDGIQLSNLILENGTTVMDINAQINSDESHNFFLNIEGMPGALFSTYIFDDDQQVVGGDYNLRASSTGFLKNPDMNVDLNIYGISYNGVNFGSLSGVLIHSDSNSKFDIDFQNTDINKTSPLLTIDGNLPLEIDFLDYYMNVNNEEDLLVSLRANEFELGSLGNVFPYIKDQYGKINSKIEIRGNIEKLTTDGFLNIDDAGFTSRDNNLQYGTKLSAVLSKQIVSLDEITLYNKGGSKYVGKLNGKGKIDLKQIPFDKIDLDIKGNLALLGKSSQTRTANIYGDLFINSGGTWKFTFQDGKYDFIGDIIIDKADLVYTTESTKNYGTNGNIIYKFLEDTSKININAQKFVRILNETKLAQKDISKNTDSQFNFNTNIIIDNIAALNFIISPDLNQKLNVETTGKLEFEKNGEDTKAHGSLTLLSGSRLEFFKTFEAVGNIRFENDITDPHFDIVATYIGEIENLEGYNETEEVAVKLKLNSAFSKLKENISGSKDNLSVYIGRTKIENDIPDTKYDQSNALTFIILDQLSLNLNDEQKSTLGAMTENAAYSLLGSQLTKYLNSSLGSLVSNIKLNRDSGRDSYKLLFSGRYNNVRYSFGGNFGSQTEYLQLSKADVKVEYLFNPNLLIRLEQKSPIVETTTEEKVQEIGLKYKFEF